MSTNKFIWMTPAPIAPGIINLNNFFIYLENFGLTKKISKLFLNIPNIKKTNWKRPAKKTAQDNICPFVSKISPKQNINIIKVRFKSIGDAAPIANLLKELSTPVYKETKEIKNKYAKVIRDNSINKFNLAGSWAKPGARKYTTTGIKNSKIIITRKRIKKSKERTSEPNCNALDFPFFFNIEEKIGTNAAENAPSANKRLKKFGSLKATKKTSAIKPAPTNAAIKISLKKPKILLTNVKPLIVRKGFINFI